MNVNQSYEEPFSGGEKERHLPSGAERRCGVQERPWLCMAWRNEGFRERAAIDCNTDRSAREGLGCDAEEG